MSSVFKSFKSNDVSLTPYIANKSWEFNKETMASNGLSLFVGENIPINRNNPFNPVNDSKTTNQEYKRLVFNTVRHLYYESYISGNLSGMYFSSSSFINYEQSTLYSGSHPTTLRNLSPITGTAGDINSQGYDFVVYDSSSLYDEAIFDPDKGGLISVLSVPQDIMGNGLQPNTFFLSGSEFYLRDDGQGNLIDFGNIENYKTYISQEEFITTDLNYIGNVFYSHGIVVITNADYICVLGAPPTTVNDYFTYINVDGSGILDVTANDFTDCGIIDYSSTEFYEYEGYDFPDFTVDGNGFIIITPNHKSYIPGEYKIKYTVRSNQGNLSNQSDINLFVDYKPLEINNLIIPSLCDASVTASQPITFSIDYGVPFYSYSFDGINYTGINQLNNVTVTDTITPNPDNTIYVKDYLGNIATETFSNYYPAPAVNIIVNKAISCNPYTGQIQIQYSGSNPVSSSLDNFTTSYLLPHTFNVESGSYVLKLRDSITNCITTQNINVDAYPSLDVSLDTTNIFCSGTNGSLTLNVTGGLNPYTISWLTPNSQVISGPFITSSIPGNYSYNVKDTNNCIVSGNVLVTSPSSPRIDNTTITDHQCYNSLTCVITGGISPYTLYATNGDSTYNSNTNTIDLINEGLEGSFWSLFVVDSNNCNSDTITVETWGRKYIYSGSYCEIES